MRRIDALREETVYDMDEARIHRRRGHDGSDSVRGHQVGMAVAGLS